MVRTCKVQSEFHLSQYENDAVVNRISLTWDDGEFEQIDLRYSPDEAARLLAEFHRVVGEVQDATANSGAMSLPMAIALKRKHRG